jgi:hypothetical protein
MHAQLIRVLRVGKVLRMLRVYRLLRVRRLPRILEKIEFFLDKGILQVGVRSLVVMLLRSCGSILAQEWQCCLDG